MENTLLIKKRTTDKTFSKKIELLLFLIGALLLLYLVERHGLKSIGNNISNSGWTIPIIAGIWALIYLLNTFAQKLLLIGFNASITFLQMLRITIIEFTMNDLIPAVAVGGEIYKLSLLTDMLDSKRAFALVTEYRIIHALGHFSFILFALLLILTVASIPSTLKFVLVCGLIITSLLTALLLMANRKGFFLAGYRILCRSKLLYKVFVRAGLSHVFFEEIDRRIVDLFYRRKKMLVASILLEFLTRNLMVVELYLIMISASQNMSFIHAYLFYIFLSLMANVFIFVPMNLGIRESGFYLLFGSISFSPQLGIYLSLIIRIREFIWFAFGLLLIGYGKLKSLIK